MSADIESLAIELRALYWLTVGEPRAGWNQASDRGPSFYTL